MTHPAERWKHDGVRVIPGNQLDPNVPSTPGMDRKAAINFARAGAKKLWAGTVTIKPDAKTGAHHHGHLESIIYVVRGKARMRWGERLEFTAEANPGDFIFIPPYVPHQEINASPDEILECVLVRSDGEAIAINLDIEPVEKPQTVLWVDPRFTAIQPKANKFHAEVAPTRVGIRSSECRYGESAGRFSTPDRRWRSCPRLQGWRCDLWAG
jgi:uncharacterized RmlC-like cupin family protein